MRGFPGNAETCLSTPLYSTSVITTNPYQPPVPRRYITCPVYYISLLFEPTETSKYLRTIISQSSNCTSSFSNPHFLTSRSHRRLDLLMSLLSGAAAHAGAGASGITSSSSKSTSTGIGRLEGRSRSCMVAVSNLPVGASMTFSPLSFALSPGTSNYGC